MSKISGLDTFFATDATLYDLVRNDRSAKGGVPSSSDHHDHVSQLFIMAFIVLVK